MFPDLSGLQTAVLGALGWAATAAISYQLGKRKSAHDRYWTAVGIFRSAMNQTMAGLPFAWVVSAAVRISTLGTTTNQFDGADHFIDAFAKFYVAVNNFRPFVRAADTRRFDLAWQKLAACCQDGSKDYRERGKKLRFAEWYEDHRNSLENCVSEMVLIVPERRWW